MPDLVFHIGFPKTGTTTLQASFFPNHHEIDYQGKLIPSHRYRDAALFDHISLLQTTPLLEPSMLENSRSRIEDILAKSKRKVVLFSSENFLHPETSDIGLVADRLACAFPKARIIIALREQVDMLYSFYRNHGAFGQYLFTMKELEAPLCLPIPIREWLQFQFLTPYKNVIGTLNYGVIIEHYMKLFGSENVLVVLFEQLRYNPKEFYCRICDFLGIHRDWWLLENTQVHNQGFDVQGFEQIARKMFASGGQDQLQDGRQIEIENSIPEPWRSKIHDRFRGSNRLTVELTGLNLSDYGYAT